jgi:hypothetical protein
MAAMEKAEDAPGANFVTTDYAAGYFNPEMVKDLCKLGRCPVGGHSIQHGHWAKWEKGNCGVTKETYDPKKPTVCGEVVVNLQILKGLMPTGARLDAWRSPYLDLSPHQFDVLAEQGIKADLSLAAGDARTNFPIDIATWPWQQDEIYHHRPLIDFPLNLEDGIGSWAGEEEERTELSSVSWPLFRAMWQRSLRYHAANGAWAVLLVHPSMGIGDNVGPKNVARKVEAVRWAIKEARANGMLLGELPAVVDFWRGRLGARVEASWQDGVGYTGTLTAGSEAAPRLTLCFGDHIESFECTACGKAEVSGPFVTLSSPLPAQTKAAFVAKVAKKP